MAMTSPFDTRQARFDAYVRSTEEAINQFRMKNLLKMPAFSGLPKDIQQRIADESRRY